MREARIDVWVCREPAAPSGAIVGELLERYPGGEQRFRTSVSHTEGMLLVAVGANCRLGVDVEVIRDRGVRSLPRHALSRREQDELARLDSPRELETFLSYWTRKEALLKAAGVGLAVEPSLIELPPPQTATHVVAVPACLGRPERWSVTELELDGFAAAVAVDVRSPRICVTRLERAAFAAC